MFAFTACDRLLLPKENRKELKLNPSSSYNKIQGKTLLTIFAYNFRRKVGLKQSATKCSTYI